MVDLEIDIIKNNYKHLSSLITNLHYTLYTILNKMDNLKKYLQESYEGIMEELLWSENKKEEIKKYVELENEQYFRINKIDCLIPFANNFHARFKEIQNLLLEEFHGKLMPIRYFDMINACKNFYIALSSEFVDYSMKLDVDKIIQKQAESIKVETVLYEKTEDKKDLETDATQDVKKAFDDWKKKDIEKKIAEFEKTDDPCVFFVDRVPEEKEKEK